MNRKFLFHNTPSRSFLWIRSRMALHHIDAIDDNSVRTPVHRQYIATLAPISTGQDDNVVSLSEFPYGHEGPHLPCGNIHRNLSPVLLPVSNDVTAESTALNRLSHRAYQLTYLQYFRCKRHDFHEALTAQLPRNRTKYSSSNWLQLVRQQNCRIPVESNQRTIGAPHTLSRANHHRTIHFALPHLTTRDCLLYGDLYDISNMCIPALRTTQYLNAHQPTSAAVVGRLEH